MFRRVYGVKRDRLVAAPPRTMLRKFGGPMTVAQFRATGALGRVKYQHLPPPLIPSAGAIQEVESVETTYTQAIDEEAITRILEEGMDFERRFGWGATRRGGNAFAARRLGQRRTHAGTAAAAKPRPKAKAKPATRRRPPAPPPPKDAPPLEVILAESKAKVRSEQEQTARVLGRQRKSKNLMDFMKPKGN
jgi:hypothetical protein